MSPPCSEINRVMGFESVAPACQNSSTSQERGREGSPIYPLSSSSESISTAERPSPG